MKNKGFTLIELLAILVILAVIATITIPLVTDIVDEAREKANRNSVSLYGREIENSIKTYMAKNKGKVPVGSYSSSVETNGKILVNKQTQEQLNLNLEYNGSIGCTTIDIYSNGKIYITGCVIGDNEVLKKGSQESFEYGESID